MTKATCTVNGCDRAQFNKRGWCQRHYNKWRTYRDPLAGGTCYKTPEESFAARTVRKGECLLWTGTAGLSSKARYGMISVGGREMLVHRYVWERDNGLIPEGMEIDHICHHTLCAEITHLRLVTPKQNRENVLGPRSSNKTSGIRGVCWDKSRSKWLAYIGHNGKLKNLGRYDDLAEAAEVAKQARLKMFTHNDRDRV